MVFNFRSIAAWWTTCKGFCAYSDLDIRGQTIGIAYKSGYVILLQSWPQPRFKTILPSTPPDCPRLSSLHSASMTSSHSNFKPLACFFTYKFEPNWRRMKWKTNAIKYLGGFLWAHCTCFVKISIFSTALPDEANKILFYEENWVGKHPIFFLSLLSPFHLYRASNSKFLVTDCWYFLYKHILSLFLKT